MLQVSVVCGYNQLWIERHMMRGGMIVLVGGMMLVHNNTCHVTSRYKTSQLRLRCPYLFIDNNL